MELNCSEAYELFSDKQERNVDNIAEYLLSRAETSGEGTISEHVGGVAEQSTHLAAGSLKIQLCETFGRAHLQPCRVVLREASRRQEDCNPTTR